VYLAPLIIKTPKFPWLHLGQVRYGGLIKFLGSNLFDSVMVEVMIASRPKFLLI